MGQAKSRGSLQQRVAMAQKRNQMLEEMAAPDGSMPAEARQAMSRLGTQRFASRLVAVGRIPNMKAAQ